MVDSVNAMAATMTTGIRSAADITQAITMGDLTKRLNVDGRGELLLLQRAMNTMTENLAQYVSEVSRVVKDVGVEGKLGGQVRVTNAEGSWKVG